MKFLSKKLTSLVAGAFLLGTASLAHAQVAEVNKQVEIIKTTAQEALKLLTSGQNTDALKKKMEAAEQAMMAAMQKVDPKNAKDGETVEKAFGEVQAANQAFSEAQLKATEQKAAEKAKQAAEKMKQAADKAKPAQAGK